MQITQPVNQSVKHKTDEQILVVKRDAIFAHHPAWHGLESAPLASVLEVIKDKREFKPRSLMETNPEYKQIIPYLIFNHGDQYFLMQRQAKASEQRLQNKYTLGIGGHIRQEDMSTDSIIDWAMREFHEEVHFDGNLEVQTLGVLNDDSNAVGQVHLGLVLLLKGDSAAIWVKSELKSGVMVSLQEIRDYYDRLEGWSQMVFDFIFG